jgi:hypothetical protein
MLQGLVAGMGAGVVKAAPPPPAAKAKVQSPDWKPEFLEAHEFATLGILCARIVPGSEKAQTDRFIDSRLAVESLDAQSRFMTALGALDGASTARFARPLKSLSEAEQVEVLTSAASGEPGQKDWVWTPGTPVVKPEEGPEVITLRDHLDHVKGWIVGSYYSSEAGLKELGYTGRMFFDSFPDCTDKDHA